ncbi:hypothetical protein [Micromonospora sp. NPDC050200]|uniref:hypothetical protein n=1 Tax=Micromonospora sp. NPDC050200 TaxID=3155664 RepID=UPI0033F93FE2
MTNPASTDLNVSEHPTTDPEANAKITAKPKRTPPKKATAAKPEFAPKVKDSGRLDHSDCEHPRTLAGRNACRANHAKAAEAK